MSDTGKISPQVTTRGIFLPWPAVLVLLISGLVPLWLFTVKAIYVADNVQTAVEVNKDQDKTLRDHGERLAAMEARKP